MKKVVILSIIVVLIITGTITISIFKDKKNIKNAFIEATKKEAVQINSNSSMAMKYLEFANLSSQDMEQFNDDNLMEKTSEDGFVEGYFFKLTPDAEDIQLTQINITGGDYHIFGIHVGDNFKEASKILEEEEYIKLSSEKDTNDDKKTVESFSKNGVIINLKVNNDSQIIDKISLLTKIQ